MQRFSPTGSLPSMQQIGEITNMSLASERPPKPSDGKHRFNTQKNGRKENEIHNTHALNQFLQTNLSVKSCGRERVVHKKRKVPETHRMCVLDVWSGDWPEEMSKRLKKKEKKILFTGDVAPAKQPATYQPERERWIKSKPKNKKDTSTCTVVAQDALAVFFFIKLCSCLIWRCSNTLLETDWWW